MSHGIIVIPQLDSEEKEALRMAMLGHGNRKKVEKATGLSHTTLYNALDGLEMHGNTLNTIRTFLQQQKQSA